MNIEMANYNISINHELAEVVEAAMERRKYANRSEFFRDLIRQYYLEQEHVEPLLSGDPDLAVLQKAKQDAEFVEFPKGV